MTDPSSADFVVIGSGIVGSGIVGSLTARKLVQAGASVLILEAGPRVTRGELVSRFRNSTRLRRRHFTNGSSCEGSRSSTRQTPQMQ